MLTRIFYLSLCFCLVYLYPAEKPKDLVAEETSLDGISTKQACADGEECEQNPPEDTTTEEEKIIFDNDGYEGYDDSNEAIDSHVYEGSNQTDDTDSSVDKVTENDDSKSNVEHVEEKGGEATSDDQVPFFKVEEPPYHETTVELIDGKNITIHHYPRVVQLNY